MDEQTNKKIEELKKNPPNRVFPLLVLVIAVIAVFLYRVASTAPNWEVAGATSSPSPLPAASPTPKANAPPQARLPVSSVPASTAASHAQSKTVEKAAVPAGETERAEKPQKAQKAQSEPVPKSETAAVSENGSDALDAYLTAHLGQEVPFLYKGEKRVVTLAAFSEKTVTIKRKKSFTMKRSELSDEQLKLWK